MINVSSEIQRILSTTDLVDPVDVAEIYLKQLDDRDLRDVLSQVLPVYVNSQLFLNRRKVVDHLPASPRSSLPSQQAASIATMSTLDSSHSSKRDAINASQQKRLDKWLHQRVRGVNRWMLLGDTTRPDVVHAAESRRRHEMANAARATMFERLAAAHSNDHTATRNLPLAVLFEVFIRGAA